MVKRGKTEERSRVDHMVKEEIGAKQNQHTLYDDTNDYTNNKQFPLIYTACFRKEISQSMVL